MAYIGSQPSDLNSGAKPRNDFTGDGATLNFTLSQSVPGGFESNVIVVVDNVIQQPLEAYTITGSNYTTLTFSEAPASGAVIYVLHQGNATQFVAPSTGSVGASALADNLRNFTVDTFTGNGSTAAFTLTETPISANSILVIVDGIIQTRTTNYTLATNVVTFTGAPDSESAITVIHLGFSTISRTGVVDGSITTTKLADAAVTTTKIADANITTAKIVDQNIINAKIADATITASKFAAGQTPSFNGIAFPTTQVSSADANTLDDYEEGTWTPTITGTGGAPASYGGQEGKYIKIGNMVYLTGIVTVSSSIPAGNYVRISNLPFGQTSGQSASAIKYSGATGMPSGQFLSATTSGSEINLVRNDGNGENGVVGLNSSYTSSSFSVVFSAMYRANS